MQSLKETPFFRLLLTILLVFGMYTLDYAQRPGGSGGQGGWNRDAMKIGRLYGKVVDENGKGVAYAAVQLYGMQFDTVTKRPTETLLAGQITAENGDFNLEKLPVRGEFTLKISFLGFGDVEQKVDFGMKGRPEGGENRPAGGPPSGAGGRGNWGGGMAGGDFEKDLGNIMLTENAKNLDVVEVVGEASSVTLALDRKVFRVEKNAMAAGGTAEDALRNVPSLSVDLDGNVTLRNASPQIFVDGRPTTLSLDQIAADAIESVEVITNPSAKFDASGGQAGIVNIVLKKDRRLGYNGNLRGGFDSQGGFNFGGNLNAREGKINAFLSANLNQFVSVGESKTLRKNLVGDPPTNITQTGPTDFTGQFLSGRGGFDWFVDNRNTFTFTGSFTRGKFTPDNIINIRTDSLYPDRTPFSEAIRTSRSQREFQRKGGSVLYKHLFPKKGKELTADLNVDRITIDGNGNFSTDYRTSSLTTLELQESNGQTDLLTGQVDYVEQLNPKMKMEAGGRIAIRNYDNNNANFLFQNDEWVRQPNFADDYSYDDNVYAAYGTFSHDLGEWGYQVGLRAESSTYTGVLPESEQTFENNYPLSLFPSAFVSYKLNEEDIVQLSYSRRINRPSFFQLVPFTDFSDSLNLRRGNANLLPEFTNSLEFTYQNFFKNGDNLLISSYYKQATDLITAYQFLEFEPNLGRDVVITGYTNSNNSTAYGAEFTLRNKLSKAIEITSNLNLYNSRIDASNVEENLINEQFTWFVKENVLINLPAEFTLQVSGEYKSRAAFSPSDGGRRHWRGSTNTAQGYQKGRGYVDVAVRKSILKRKGTLTLSVSDIFATRISGSYSESAFFIQDSERFRNQQLVRLNFSYRFGKPDISLFKRKNNRVNTEGMDMMQ